MLATLLGAIRADIDRQVGWARGEVGRQLRYTALTGALAAFAALAAVGAIVVGLIALYRWLATQTDPFIALGMIGGGLLLFGLILLALAFVRRRPRSALRRRIAQPPKATFVTRLQPSAPSPPARREGQRESFPCKHSGHC